MGLPTAAGHRSVVVPARPPGYWTRFAIVVVVGTPVAIAAGVCAGALLVLIAPSDPCLPGEPCGNDTTPFLLVAAIAALVAVPGVWLINRSWRRWWARQRFTPPPAWPPSPPAWRPPRGWVPPAAWPPAPPAWQFWGDPSERQPLTPLAE